jgi:hypothetical protein
MFNTPAFLKKLDYRSWPGTLPFSVVNSRSDQERGGIHCTVHQLPTPLKLIYPGTPAMHQRRFNHKETLSQMLQKTPCAIRWVPSIPKSRVGIDLGPLCLDFLVLDLGRFSIRFRSLKSLGSQTFVDLCFCTVAHADCFPHETPCMAFVEDVHDLLASCQALVG